MCAVKCDPRRIGEEQPRRRGLKRYVGVAVLLFSLGGLAVVKLDVPWVQQITRTIGESPAYLAVHEAAEPVARVASGDVDYVRRWVVRQRITQLLLLCIAGVSMGLFYILWK